MDNRRILVHKKRHLRKENGLPMIVIALQKATRIFLLGGCDVLIMVTDCSLDDEGMRICELCDMSHRPVETKLCSPFRATTHETFVATNTDNSSLFPTVVESCILAWCQNSNEHGCCSRAPTF